MNNSLRIGHLGLLDSAPLLLAEQRGFFRDEGLSVTFTCELGLSSLIDKWIDGRLTGACLPAALPVLLSLGSSIGTIPIEQAFLLSYQDLAIVRTRPPVGVKRPPGPPLRVGIPVHDTAARVIVQRWLQQFEPRAEVSLLPLSIHQLPSFLRDQFIDAFCATEPLPALATLRHDAEVICHSGEFFPLHPGSAIALRSDGGAGGSEATAAFGRALARALTICNAPGGTGELWPLILAQPPFVEFGRSEPTHAATLVADHTARASLRFAAEPRTPLSADAVSFLEQVCRASPLRQQRRDADLTSEIRRLYRAR